MTCNRLRNVARIFLLAAVVMTGCTSNPNGGTGGKGQAGSIPPELRGVWDGRITLSARTGQMTHGRLILGREPILILQGQGKTALIPREQQVAEPHFLQTQRRVAMTFDARVTDGPLKVRSVRVESPFVHGNSPRAAKVTVDLQFEPSPGADLRYTTAAGGEMWQPMALAAVYGQGPRYPYFAYADWRSSPSSSPHSRGDGVRSRASQLAQQLDSYGQWKCLAGDTFTVRPGEVYEWQKAGKNWVGQRLFVFCAHESDDLAIQVGDGGVPFHILNPGTSLDYPAMVIHPYLAGWSNPYFSFQHRYDDPDTALSDQAKAQPVTITLLIFGRSPADRGPGFNFATLPE